ncbi:hypothetical protein L6R52_23665 [Myxococcota bacterium]|nr:hypothetical protein [Myxococcota bacterium]
MSTARLSFVLAVPAILVGCTNDPSGPPRCGSGDYSTHHLVPGPKEPGFDAELERAAARYDRTFHAASTFATGLNADLEVRDADARADLVAFTDDATAWDFEVARGRAVTSVVDGWQKSAGLYAGVGIAADAYRYAVLRDQGYACDEIDAARAHLVRALETMHIASDITGVPGVIARSLARKDLPGDGQRVTVTPLFDEAGNPLPQEKDNGTWRADNSGGRYPDWVWEDSTSRDMLVGWAMAYGAAWEVIADDATFDGALKAQLQADARALGRSLMTVREQGYDLEIRDADGRTTFHGYINENAFERGYIPGISNGFYANMAVGIVAAFAYVAEDPELDRWLGEDLLGTRDLAGIAATDMVEVDLGYVSNFSVYNMAFTAIWLGGRYVRDETSRGKLRLALDRGLYERRGSTRQPSEQKQSFFDFVFAAGMADAQPGAPAKNPLDAAAIARGLETLREFPAAPFWEEARPNCDEAELASRDCTLLDGTVIRIAPQLGRGDTVVAETPIPMRVRPASNYLWRSNPYAVNGDGDGTRMLPGVDFRVAYWLGRAVRGPDL